MKQVYSYNIIGNSQELSPIKNKWLTTLVSPQDGMWEHFRESGTNYKICHGDITIGYAVTNQENQLIQFYISPSYFSKSKIIFQDFIDKWKIQSGIVGTNNPIFLSIVLDRVKELNIHTCLFRDFHKIEIDKKDGTLKQCQDKDCENIMNFCHISMGAPKEWLLGYIKGLIKRGEIFSCEIDHKIIGTFEVRKSFSSPKFADIGMVVSPDFRRMGYGTFLLNEAKNTALEWGKIPICSCEKENIGSLKSIQNCGFVSFYQLLSVIFK